MSKQKLLRIRAGAAQEGDRQEQGAITALAGRAIRPQPGRG